MLTRRYLRWDFFLVHVSLLCLQSGTVLCFRATSLGSTLHGSNVTHRGAPGKHANNHSLFFPINTKEEALDKGLNDPPTPAHDDNYDDNSAIPRNPEGGIPRKAAFSRIPSLLGAVYLFSAIAFILCLRGLSTPDTAKRGNFIGILGMATAVIVTFSEEGFHSQYLYFFVAVLPALVIGFLIGERVGTVHIPQLVALFHSFVGLSAILVSLSSFHSTPADPSEEHLAHSIELVTSIFIAAVTFSGSLIAAAKLHEIINSSAWNLPGKHAINSFLFGTIVFFAVTFCVAGKSKLRLGSLYCELSLSILLGVHLIGSIGGADMPVVISLLNSYSGFATAASGFMLDNNLLIISGSLIGASGAILSYVMCKGMNRSLTNVVFGGWDQNFDYMHPGGSGIAAETTWECVVEELLGAKRVVIVPGYGMAVSRCQADIAQIARFLISRGIDVQFCIHPVAGRMPGHMNVLLAEADVPYYIVKEMDEINPKLETFDVALVIGANDIINPASLEEDSKIAGMPVIEIWKVNRVIVLKRSLSSGYAGIDNPLFYSGGTRMLFGDAKQSATSIYAGIKARADLVQCAGAITHSASFQDDINTVEVAFPVANKSLGVLKDDYSDTTLVSIVPSSILRLRRLGYRVYIQSGAGIHANFSDEAFQTAGAVILQLQQEVISVSEVIVQIMTPTLEIISSLQPGQLFISQIWPARHPELLSAFATRKITAIAVDEVPRTSRAQKLDVRTSMSSLQGYRAVIEAFNALPRLSKPSITAAGRVDAARVLVLGAGVAGLQAIATAHSMGAQVFANDTRFATREEVESCGGTFLPIEMEEDAQDSLGYATELNARLQEAQKKIISKFIKTCDIVVCTAAIPGKSSPKLISTPMVKTMKPGSVIVDLATENGATEEGWGGNCECSVREGDITVNQVNILGRSKIETRMANQASELYSMNIVNLLEELGEDPSSLNLNDQILREMCVAYNGTVLWKQQQPVAAKQKSFVPNEPVPIKTAKKIDIKQIIASDLVFFCCVLLALVLMGFLGAILDTLEMQHFFLFSLSLVVGYYCVWSVTPALHTPLMSVTNALSGIIIIGSMVQYDKHMFKTSTLCALVATFLAALNISGGFNVTHRMLHMFSIS